MQRMTVGDGARARTHTLMPTGSKRPAWLPATQNQISTPGKCSMPPGDGKEFTTEEITTPLDQLTSNELEINLATVVHNW